jgi:hypothetical protein
MRFWNGFVRAIYLIAAIVASLTALLYGTSLLVSLFQRSLLFPRVGLPLKDIAVALGVMCSFLIPGIRALRRRIADGAVIPIELVNERPTVAGLVTLAGGVGHLFLALFVAAVIDLVLAPVWPEEGGKIIILVMVAMFFYLIALLCGELALVGDGESDGMKKGTDLFIDEGPHRRDAPRIINK